MQRAVKLALDLVQAAQDQGEAVGAGHDHQSNSERKEEAPASTSGRGLNWQRTPLVRSCLGEWQEALSLPHPRAEPPLVAQTPSEDLFIGAKDLFGAAIMVLQKPSSLLIEHDGLIRFEERPLDHRLRQSVPRGCDPRCARFRPGRAAPCARALSMRLQAFGETALRPAAVAAISDDCGPATSRRASTRWMRSKVQVVLDQRMLVTARSESPTAYAFDAEAIMCCA